MTILIGVCGAARHGKDSIAQVFEQYAQFKRFAFADKLREIALAIDPYVKLEGQFVLGWENQTTFERLSEVIEKFGWDKAKEHPDVRRLLQRIGTEAGRQIISPTLWIDLTMHEVLHHPRAVISDVRFPNEAVNVQLSRGVLIYVYDPRKQENGVGTGHESEQHLEYLKSKSTYIICNDGTLEELATKVKRIADEVLVAV